MDVADMAFFAAFGATMVAPVVWALRRGSIAGILRGLAREPARYAVFVVAGDEDVVRLPHDRSFDVALAVDVAGRERAHHDVRGERLVSCVPGAIAILDDDGVVLYCEHRTPCVERAGSERRHRRERRRRTEAMPAIHGRGALRRHHSAIRPAVESRARKVAFGREVLVQEDFRLVRVHRGEIVDVAAASAAVPHAIVADHVFPRRVARRLHREAAQER